MLCELGGWKSPKTVLECYQQADLESQRGLQAARYPTDTSGPIVWKLSLHFSPKTARSCPRLETPVSTFPYLWGHTPTPTGPTP